MVKHSRLIFFFALTVACIVFIYGPVPSDDYLRHVRYLDYKPLGGYSYMFKDSYIDKLHFNPWYGFDMTVGLVASALGRDMATRVLESLFFALYFLTLYRCLAPEKKDLMGVAVVTVMFIVALSGVRIGYLRPASMVAMLYLFLLTPAGVPLTVATVAFAAVSYWLYWVFFMPLGLAHVFKGSRKHGVAILATTVAGLCGWAMLTGGQYIDAVVSIVKALFGGSRRGMLVGENTYSLPLLFKPEVFVLFASALATFIRKKEVGYHVLLILLAIPAGVQNRYFYDMIVPVAGVYVFNSNTDLLSVWYQRQRKLIDSLAVLSLLMVIWVAALLAFHHIKLREINIPENSIVVAAQADLVFPLIYYNKQHIRTYPFPEVGWLSDKDRDFFMDTHEGKDISEERLCRYLKEKKADYFVSFSYYPARCLRFVRSFDQTMYRRVLLWAVR
jgi:hypothetical protein